MALHDARLLELSAAAWQAVACQGPPPPPPATTSGGGAAQQHLRCCQVCAINLAGSPSYFQVREARSWSSHPHTCCSCGPNTQPLTKPLKAACVRPQLTPPSRLCSLQRIRACKEHVSATSVQLNGGVQRFCQQVRACG